MLYSYNSNFREKLSLLDKNCMRHKITRINKNLMLFIKYCPLFYNVNILICKNKKNLFSIRKPNIKRAGIF